MPRTLVRYAHTNIPVPTYPTIRDFWAAHGYSLTRYTYMGSPHRCERVATRHKFIIGILALWNNFSQGYKLTRNSRQKPKNGWIAKKSQGLSGMKMSDLAALFARTRAPCDRPKTRIISSHRKTRIVVLSKIRVKSLRTNELLLRF